jgi:PPOX class probable F420-dependent enzyme
MNRRKAISLSEDERREMLASSLTIILSSIDGRGYPHSVAMWYAVRDGRVLMTTYAKSQKTRNLQRNPRCCLLVESGTEYSDLRGVLIRGRAELTFDVDAVLDALADIRAKHGLGGAAPAPEVAEAMRAHAAKRVLITVIPEHVASWDHRKLGGAY